MDFCFGGEANGNRSSIPGREKVGGSPLHVDDLLIKQADCSPGLDQSYDCQVSYVRKANLNGRLYFDVISLEPRHNGWKLDSGLCRGKKVETSL